MQFNRKALSTIIYTLKTNPLKPLDSPILTFNLLYLIFGANSVEFTDISIWIKFSYLYMLVHWMRFINEYQQW